MSQTSTQAEQHDLLCLVETLGPVEFMPLRDAFRKRYPDMSAHAVRNMLVALINRKLVVFGVGARRMSYALGEVSPGPALKPAPPEVVFCTERLLYTLRQAGRLVCSAELVAVYPGVRATKLFDALNDLYDRGQIEREGRRGSYRYRWVDAAQRLTPEQVRQRRQARMRKGPVVRMVSPAVPLETPAMHPSWIAAPAPEFGRPAVGVRCEPARRIAA